MNGETASELHGDGHKLTDARTEEHEVDKLMIPVNPKQLLTSATA